ncbi:MAG: hypothetical protein HY308_08455 [Gammaproteobacteria bacterium]|nr:hypothetical protein [Gammaproteobacteria bacterium]
MSQKKRNPFLVIGGVLSLIGSLLHIGIIVGGPAWYRFFGAGEQLIALAEEGSAIPNIVTFAIALLLFVWALYAFSGAGLIRRLPLLRTALVGIAFIYLLRGLAIIPAWFATADDADPFLLWSSLICLVYGLCYAIGAKQVWCERALIGRC